MAKDMIRVPQPDENGSRNYRWSAANAAADGANQLSIRAIGRLNPLRGSPQV